MSTIPPAAQQAAQNALNAAIDADNANEDSRAGSGNEEDESAQVLEVDSPAANLDRTVFEDPKSFNVKVGHSRSSGPLRFLSIRGPSSTHYILRGLFGSTLRTPKTSQACQALQAPQHLPHQGVLRHKAGWMI